MSGMGNFTILSGRNITKDNSEGKMNGNTTTKKKKQEKLTANEKAEGYSP